MSCSFQASPGPAFWVIIGGKKCRARDPCAPPQAPAFLITRHSPVNRDNERAPFKVSGDRRLFLPCLEPARLSTG
jgi:hypothetical protein